MRFQPDNVETNGRERRGALDEHAPLKALARLLARQAARAAERITEEQLRAYHHELITQVAPCTVAGRFTDLHEALRVMVPDRQFPYLTRAMYTLKSRAKPTRNKRAKYVHPHELFKPTLCILDRFESEPCTGRIYRAGRYRDYLMIAVLANWAVRRRNFCAVTLGTHLRKVGERYQLRFEGSETKNHDYIEGSLAATLTPYIDRYLEVYRPILLKGRTSDRLWISIHGTDMAEISIYFRVRKVTEREFGVRLNLHAFRDGPPTALATDDPAHVGAAMPILGQRDPRMFNKHYNQAKAVEAVQRFQKNVLELKASASPRKGSRSWKNSKHRTRTERT